MGAAIITNAGKSYLAAKQAAGLPAVFNTFVFALIPGLVTSSTPPGTEALPAAGNIKYTCPVLRAGYVTPDQCVYSVLVDSSVGDWSFNWIGLKADDGTLAAVVYVPETTKEKYDSLLGHIGNNLTRNMLLQYDNLQTITAITVNAATWQIDFTQRLDASDAMQETLAKALVGNGALFLGNALKIENASGFKMRAGRAIIGGHIVEITTDVDASAAGAAASKHIWVDIWRSGDVNGVVVHAGIVADIATATHNNYTDGNGIAHTVVKIASISAGGVVTDLRGTNGVLFTSNAAFDEFAKINHVHTPAQVGLGNLPNAKSDVAADNSNILATIKCVFDAVNSAISGAASNLAAHIANVSNPHATTKAQVGLGNLPNAISDTPANNSGVLASVKAVWDHLQSAAAHTSAQVGLGNLPNAKSDSLTTNNSNILATAKAIFDTVALIAFTKKHAPAEQPMPAAGASVTLNHNLGVEPFNCQVFLRCVTADLGISVGKLLLISTTGGGQENWDGGFGGVTVTCDNAGVTVLVSADGYWIPYGGGRAALTPAKWTVVAKVSA